MRWGLGLHDRVESLAGADPRERGLVLFVRGWELEAISSQGGCDRRLEQLRALAQRNPLEDLGHHCRHGAHLERHPCLDALDQRDGQLVCELAAPREGADSPIDPHRRWLGPVLVLDGHLAVLDQHSPREYSRSYRIGWLKV